MNNSTTIPNTEFDLKIGDKVTIEFEVTERQDNSRRLVKIDYIDLKTNAAISGAYQVNSLHVKRR